jgi:peptidoglycan/LPS O-acetylase OafA/YrhL
VLCYSLYLTHWPTVLIVARTLYLRGVTDPLRTVTITVPLCLLVAIPVGWIFHVLVEKHFLNPSQRVVIAPDQRELAVASTAITADGVHAN